MNTTENQEDMYEGFEGDVRKLDELVGQLELWSDEYTINHKKEEIRLPQYIELHYNLEELKKSIFAFLNQNKDDNDKKEYLDQKRLEIEHRLKEYEVTEENIHNWIREIKMLYPIIANSPILENNRDYLEQIIKQV